MFLYFGGHLVPWVHVSHNQCPSHKTPKTAGQDRVELHILIIRVVEPHGGNPWGTANEIGGHAERHDRSNPGGE